MKQKPNPPDYPEQIRRNEQLFYTLLRQFRPDLFVLTELIDDNKMNLYVVFKILRQLLTIANGSKWGRVIVNISDNKITYVEGVDTDKVDENIFNNT